MGRSKQKQRVIFVTGAATGIGAAIVRQCVARGDRVIAADINMTELNKLGRELGDSVRATQLDVRDPARWERAFESSEKSFGPIDVLVNNAGVCLPGRCDEVSVEDERMTIDVNLMGVMHGVRAAIPRFLARRSGHIINVASMAAFAPVPELASYSASKHAVRAYTHACAIDHRHSPLHFTLVYPSAVQTPMLDGMRQKEKGVLVFNERAMPPSKIAEAVLSAIDNPRREVCVPEGLGRALRVAGLFPGLLSRTADGAEKRARKLMKKRKV